MIDMADYGGDGLINFAGCRIVTADDVLNMKQTLTADLSDWGMKSLPRSPASSTRTRWPSSDARWRRVGMIKVTIPSLETGQILTSFAVHTRLRRPSIFVIHQQGRVRQH